MSVTDVQVEFDLVKLEFHHRHSLGEEVGQVVVQWNVVYSDVSGLEVVMNKSFLDAKVLEVCVIGKWRFLDNVESQLDCHRRCQSADQERDQTEHRASRGGHVESAM
jgi:hypothetical protein